MENSEWNYRFQNVLRGEGNAIAPFHSLSVFQTGLRSALLGDQTCDALLLSQLFSNAKNDVQKTIERSRARIILRNYC